MDKFRTPVTCPASGQTVQVCIDRDGLGRYRAAVWVDGAPLPETTRWVLAVRYTLRFPSRTPRELLGVLVGNGVSRDELTPAARAMGLHPIGTVEEAYYAAQQS